MITQTNQGLAECQSFTNRGACCVELVDPGAPQALDHGGCTIPSFRGALTWFETLKQ